MEAERQREKKERQVSEKNTPFNIKEAKAKAAAEARENSPELTALYNLFLPGAGPGHSRPKFMTDKYGNRFRVQMEIDNELLPRG